MEDPEIHFSNHLVQDQSFNLVCGNCSARFWSCHDLQAHCVRAHSLPKFMCSVCKHVAKNTISLRKHFKKHKVTTKKQYYCEPCDRDVGSQRVLSKHIKHHILKPGLMCCGRLYNSETRFQSHLDLRHRTDFMCELCGQTFKTRESYVTHRSLHDGVYLRRYRCKICDRAFRGSSGLRYHIESVHEGKRYVCEICEKVFLSGPKFQEHLQLHTGEKSFHCHVCGKSFARSGTLVDHLRVHTKERPFICKLCNKGFTQRSSMNLHIRGVHKENQLYDCGLCGKRFINESSLDIHMKLHPFGLEVSRPLDGGVVPV